MSSTTHYDVILIGTGAGGGTLLHRLAPTGRRILVLERGEFLPREKDNWDSRRVVVEGKYKSHETWLDREGKEFHPGIHYAVGGNTKVYGAALLRMRREDFGPLRHHGGLSPAWPVAYEEMEPYYTAAERLYEVHGTRGIDPTEPAASAPYPFPAVSHEPRIQELHDDLVRLGHRPFPLPVGVRLDEANRWKSSCIRCETCDGYPCLLGAKSDAETMAVRPALARANVTLWTGARAERIVTDASGRVATGVVVERNGERLTVTGDVIVAAAGAINTAALLLRSGSDAHPNGLANGSDQVGRNYMCHNNSALLAISRKPNPTRFQKTLGLNDFYFGAPDFDFPLGHIAMLGKSDVETLRSGAPAFAPGVALEVMAKHALDFWLTSEDLPDPENRVLVDRSGAIRLHYRENNLEGHRRLVDKLKGLVSNLGCEHHLIDNPIYLGKKIPLAGTAHQCGTTRMGTDPSTSVVDRHCRSHEVDNLYVVDGGVFVSSSAVNPALTIMANALRVGDHLAERLGA